MFKKHYVSVLGFMLDWSHCNKLIKHTIKSCNYWLLVLLAHSSMKSAVGTNLNLKWYPESGYEACLKYFELKKYFLKYDQKSKTSYIPMTPSVRFHTLPHRLVCVQSGFWLLWLEWSPFCNLSIVFNALFTSNTGDIEAYSEL